MRPVRVLAVMLAACGPTLGADCLHDTDCGSEFVCGRSIVVNGVQHGSCVHTCTSDTQCVGDERCVSWRDVSGAPLNMCLVRCNNDDDEC